MLVLENKFYLVLQRRFGGEASLVSQQTLHWAFGQILQDWLAPALVPRKSPQGSETISCLGTNTPGNPPDSPFIRMQAKSLNWKRLVNKPIETGFIPVSVVLSYIKYFPQIPQGKREQGSSLIPFSGLP